MHMYKNPLLDWAIRGEGEAPSLVKAKQLLLVLNESSADANNLVRDLEARYKRALEIKADVDKGIQNVAKFINEHPKSKDKGPSQES
jgi:hypothetical protein